MNGSAAFILAPGGGGTGSYSTDEVLTGQTWIDGKPIYRKAVTKQIPTVICNPNTFTILGSLLTISEIDVLNIDTIIRNEALYNTNGINISLPYSTNNLSQIKLSYDTELGIHISFLNNGNQSVTRNGQSYTLIIEYTKTTD